MKKTHIQTMQERYGGIKEKSMDRAWGKFGMGEDFLRVGRQIQ